MYIVREYLAKYELPMKIFKIIIIFKVGLYWIICLNLHYNNLQSFVAEMWHKAVKMKHPMRLEHTRGGLLV